MAPRLEFFPFRFRDLRTGKWIRARYVAELHEIKARYAEWEIIGPPEIREITSEDRHFSPHPRDTPLSNLGAALTIVRSEKPVTVAGVAT